MIPLRHSHVAFYVAVVTLTVTIAVGFGFWFIRQQMLTGNDFLLDAESKAIVTRVAQLPQPVDAQKLEASLKENIEYGRALFYFQVHEPGGKVIYRSPNLGSYVLDDLTGGLAKRTLNLTPLGMMRVAEYYTPTVHLQIAMSLRNFQTINDSFVRVFLVGVPFIAILSICFGVALRHSTLRPVRLMQDSARRISASNLSERIVVSPGGGEMADLACLFNEMIVRLEKSFNHAKRFTADVSHELMTPLSIIRLHAERLLNDPALPEKYRHSVEEQLQETLRLAETLQRLLMLAKAESSALTLRLQSIAISDFMSQFADDAQMLAESQGLRVVLAQNENGAAIFDEGWIRQVLFNLLSNALRFSPTLGVITIYSKFVDHNWIVEVWDEGQGVPIAKLYEIFERFVQITPRSEPSSGFGLGLAMCKGILALHNGHIAARNRTDCSGLIVAFTLPLKIPTC